MSWSCCTHTVRSLTLEYPFEIRKQSPLKKLRNLNLNLRRETWRFPIWLRVLNSLRTSSRCLRKFSATACEQQELDKESYVYWTVHHLDSWVKIDQLDVTCFIISLFKAQHVSDVNTSILRSLRLICWVISWVVLFWFDVCWCYVVVWLWWCGIRMQAETLVLQPAYGYHVEH